MGAEVKPINQKPVVYFKYKPKEEKLVIECQPIRPYSMVDQVTVDRLNRSQDKASPKGKSNPGFKSWLAGTDKGGEPVPNNEGKLNGLWVLA